MPLTIEQLQEVLESVRKELADQLPRFNTNKLNEMLVSDEDSALLKKLRYVEISYNPYLQGGVFLLSGLDPDAITLIQKKYSFEVTELVNGLGPKGLPYLLSPQAAANFYQSVQGNIEAPSRPLSARDRSPSLGNLSIASADSGNSCSSSLSGLSIASGDSGVRSARSGAVRSESVSFDFGLQKTAVPTVAPVDKKKYLLLLQEEVNQSEWNTKGQALFGKKVPTHIQKIRDLLKEYNIHKDSCSLNIKECFNKVAQVIAKANATHSYFRDNKVTQFYQDQQKAISAIQQSQQAVTPGPKSVGPRAA